MCVGGWEDELDLIQQAAAKGIGLAGRDDSIECRPVGPNTRNNSHQLQFTMNIYIIYDSRVLVQSILFFSFFFKVC